MHTHYDKFTFSHIVFENSPKCFFDASFVEWLTHNTMHNTKIMKLVNETIEHRFISKSWGTLIVYTDS